MKSWTNITQQNNLFVSINLSGKQFQEQDVVQTISQAMCQADISASNLKLEITESIIMSDVQTSSKILWQMKDMGIQLAIDDFGTGYSSLSYLQRFPIDYIKIDRSFIWAMEESSQNLELIKAIVAMGHNLEHKLIAEGIESRSQLQLLQDIGCDMGQGFYFAKPMPAPEVSKYLDLYTTQTLLYT
jgi:EAL domain-containing protein (putative c-di-GMP-specific phosphodiesterase class I)